MLARAYSAALHGISAYLLTVEADLSNGLPLFTVVGLPDAAVQESRERVRAAVKNSGFTFPNNKRVTTRRHLYARESLPACYGSRFLI